MRRLALLALLSTLPALADDEVEIRAHVVETETLDASSPLRASGDVRIRTGTLLLRAPTLEIDRTTRRATLGDGVVGADGLFVLTARRVEADLATSSVRLIDGELVLKKDRTAPQLRKAVESETPTEAADKGINRLTLRAESLERDGEAWQAGDVWLTICECAPGATPPIAVTASSVDVKPGDEITLHWPVFRLFDTIPVTPPIPRLTLPLVSRRTGFLFPVLSLSGPGGISVEQPFFLTLGESADLTLRPRWFRGTELADMGGTGVRGFGGEVEGRWRPADHAFGSLRVAHLFDTSKNEGSSRGNRFFGALDHRQRLLGGALGITAQVASDSGWLRDTATLPALARKPYLASRATWSRATPHLQTAWESTVLQDLRPARDPLSALPATVAPLAKLDLQLLGDLGPLFSDGVVSVSLEEPTPGLELAAGRTSRFVAGTSLGQTLPIVRGRGGSVVLELGERAEFLAPRGFAADWRAGGYAGLVASTRVSRAFGDFVHDLTPSVRIRGLGAVGTTTFGARLDAPRALTAPQSATDVALPADATAQLVTRLGTSLSHKGRSLGFAALEHHAALAPFDAGQAVLYVWVPVLKATVTGGGAYDLALKQPTLAWARLGGPALGLWWTAGGTWLAGATNDRIARGLDLLFTPRPALGTASGRVLQGDAWVNGSIVTNLGVRAGVTGSYDPASGSSVVTYAAAASYGAAGCGQVSAGVSWTKGFTPTIAFSFDLGDVGAVAAAVAKALPDAG